MTASSTKDQFDAAVRVIQSLPKHGTFQPSQELMLRFYSLFKQARFGLCRDPKPAFWDVVGKAKWTSWSSLANLSHEQAMAFYVDELKNVIETMPHTPEVSAFIETLGNFYETVEDSDSLPSSHHTTNSSPPIISPPALSILPTSSTKSAPPPTITEPPMLLADSQRQPTCSLPPDILCGGEIEVLLSESLSKDDADELRAENCPSPSSSDEDVFCDTFDHISSPGRLSYSQTTTSNHQLVESVNRLQREVSSLAARLGVLEDLTRPYSSSLRQPNSSSVQSFIARAVAWFSAIRLRSRTTWWIVSSPILIFLLHRYFLQRRQRRRRLL